MNLIIQMMPNNWMLLNLLNMNIMLIMMIFNKKNNLKIIKMKNSL